MFVKFFIWYLGWGIFGVNFDKWFFDRGLLIFLMYGYLWGIFGAYKNDLFVGNAVCGKVVRIC